MVFIYCSGVVNAFESEIQGLDQTQCVASSGPCCDTFLAGKGQKAGSNKATSQHPVHLGSCRSCNSRKKKQVSIIVSRATSRFTLAEYYWHLPGTFPDPPPPPMPGAADEEKIVLNIINIQINTIKIRKF